MYRGCQKNVPIEDLFSATTPYAAILFSEPYYDKRYTRSFQQECTYGNDGWTDARPGLGKGGRMNNSSQQDTERKKAIFDAMSPRRQRHILKRGYHKWDPFQEPKDPIDIRKDKSKRTAQMLVNEFLHMKKPDGHSPCLRQGSSRNQPRHCQ